MLSNKVKKLEAVGLGLGLLLTQVSVVLADDVTITRNPTWITITDIGTLISGLVALAMAIAGLLAFVYLVWGGVEWISSGGDKAGLEAARNRITNALVGLFIVAAAWAVTILLQKFFNIQILEGFTMPTGYK